MHLAKYFARVNYLVESPDFHKRLFNDPKLLCKYTENSTATDKLRLKLKLLIAVMVLIRAELFAVCWQFI